jgi:hypothetical protein
MSTTKSLRTHRGLCGPTPEIADYLQRNWLPYRSVESAQIPLIGVCGSGHRFRHLR